LRVPLEILQCIVLSEAARGYHGQIIDPSSFRERFAREKESLIDHGMWHWPSAKHLTGPEGIQEWSPIRPELLTAVQSNGEGV
jgi:hypothetical protein